MREDTVVQLRQPGSFEGRSSDGGFASWCAAFTWASGGGGSCRFCRGVCASDGLGRPPSDRTPRAFAGARDPDRHWSGCGALSQGARPRRRRDGAAGSLHLTDLASLSQARQVDRGTPALALSEGHLHGRFLRGACGALGARGAGPLGLDHCPPQRRSGKASWSIGNGAISRPSVMSTSGPTASTSHHGSTMTSNACA